MDTRVELLDAFYQTMRKDKVKIENKKYGFAFIDGLIADDVMLDYGQMESNFIHKYRLLNVSESRREKLLQGHVNQEYNVCLYFDETANNTCCFNLDNNFKANNNAIIPEIELAVDYLQQHLGKYGMETLSIKSGRGYHLWCRFERPIANQLLLDFMIRIASKTLASLQYSHHDYRTIKINMSPNPKFVKVLSLRAFGSRHIRTGSFSQIRTKDGVLDEEESWKYFSDYIKNKTISEQQFMRTYDQLAKKIPW
jgi:hypothetical protein